MTENKGLIIGWAEIDITPLKPAALIGQFHDRLAVEVRDPLKAVAMAISSADGEGSAIIVSCDLCMIISTTKELLRKKISQRAPEIDPELIQLSATHIHTGPYQYKGKALIGNLSFGYPEQFENAISPEEYADFLTDRLCDVIKQAWDGRRKSSVSWQLAYAACGFNRRILFDDGTAKMYGKSDSPSYIGPEGPEDDGAELLYTFDDTGALTGIIINIAYPAQVLGVKSYISADIWADVRALVRQKYGKSVFVLPLCGAAGDRCPKDLARRDRSSGFQSDEEHAADVAMRVLAAVESRYEKAENNKYLDPVIRHETHMVEIPVRKICLSEYLTQKKIYAELIKKYDLENKNLDKRVISSTDLRELYISESTVAIYERRVQDPMYRIETHYIRIGDVALISNPFELFTAYGLIIKARSKAVQTFIAQLSDDSLGYVPTEKAVEGGDYSAFTPSGIIGPEGGRLYVEYSVKYINDLWND